jgi:hypothetical protein
LTDWEFVDDVFGVSEIHLADTDQTEEDGFVYKEILRTGEWPAIPTRAGQINKPLRVVRDGASSRDNGTISLSEILSNFQAGAIPRVQVPLSDTRDDHPDDITRVNTGFVRELFIKDEEDGISKLVAKIEFTEPDVKEKALRGTYADVSSGIPWGIKSKGKEFGTCLEHVAITNTGFIDGLGPFALAASNKEAAEKADFVHFGLLEELERPVDISYEEKHRLLVHHLTENLQLKNYHVGDIVGDFVRIRDKSGGFQWDAPFSVVAEDKVDLAPISEWKTIAIASEDSAEEEADEPPVTVPEIQPQTELSALEHARRLRKMRLSQGNSNTTSEVKMPMSREELDRLELSDSQRAAFQSLLEENVELRSVSREKEIDDRIAELSELGFSDRPGALKFYRQVALSEDGGPATVLLSDKGQREELSAQEILDRFIDAVKGTDEKITLSDQQLLTNHDDPKPPENAENEVERPFEDRLAEAQAAIGVSS